MDDLACRHCAYFRDVAKEQKANGLTHRVGICVFEVFQALTFADLEKANPVEVEPTDEACADFRPA